MNVVCLCSLVFIALTGEVLGENVQKRICSQKFKGYKINYRRRQCVEKEATGCVNPFPYKTKEECMSGFREEGLGKNIQEYICSQKFKGYKINYLRRQCVEKEATGCVNPFPYKTKEECMSDFRGNGNLCDSSPCRHGGLCLPVTKTKKGRTFKCDCLSTGYYGSRCQRRCPRVLNGHSKQTACILIG